MMQTSNQVREKYFQEFYAFNIIQTSNRCLDEEVQQAKLHSRKHGAEKRKKESEVKIESTLKGEDPTSDIQDTACGANYVTLQDQISCRVQLIGKGEVIATNLANFVGGDEFACLHNQQRLYEWK